MSDEGLETDPGALSESEELGARSAAPVRDILKLAGFLIVEGTGILDLLPYESPGGCITDRRRWSMVSSSKSQD